jgi:uncharacterized membrane protein
MPDPSNPLIPTGYDVVWTTTAVIVPLLLVIALVSLARAARRLTPTQSLAWTLVAILVPVLGPLAWLFVGRRSALPGPGGSAA